MFVVFLYLRIPSYFVFNSFISLEDLILLWDYYSYYFFQIHVFISFHLDSIDWLSFTHPTDGNNKNILL